MKVRVREGLTVAHVWGIGGQILEVEEAGVTTFGGDYYVVRCPAGYTLRLWPDEVEVLKKEDS